MKISIPKKFYSQLDTAGGSNVFLQSPITVLLPGSRIITIDGSEVSELDRKLHTSYQLLKSKQTNTNKITPEIAQLLEVKQWQFKVVEALQTKLVSLTRRLERYFNNRLGDNSKYFTCKGMSLFTACSQGEKLAATKELYIILSTALSECDILYSMANPNYINEDNLKKFVSYYNEMDERLLSSINNLESNKALTHHRLGKIFEDVKTSLGVSANASAHLHQPQGY